MAFASSAAIDSAAALEMCQFSEKIGFESVWGGEQVIIPTKIDSAYPYTADGKIPVVPDQPIPAPLIWLAYVAACGV